MPRSNTKAQAQQFAEDEAEQLLLASILFFDTSDDEFEHEQLKEYDEWDAGLITDGYSEILQLAGFQWSDLAEWISAEDRSRGPYNQIPKSLDFFSVCLQAPDREFRHMFRMGRNTFDSLVAMIFDHHVFRPRNARGRPQRHVKYQLACFLIRYGVSGSDTLSTAQKLSIGHGTVFLYCGRVRKALRSLRPQYLSFPDGDRDGCLVNFEEIPLVQGPHYMSRKRRFSTNVQATCDHEKRFTSYELGWPGGVPDVKVFKHSDLWLRRNRYFGPQNYLLVDKGYPSTPYTIRPFDEPEIASASTQDRSRMHRFNHRLSRVRISIEHAFGLLKARFPSLRNLGPHKDIQDVYKTIEVLLILHNICLDLQDKPEERWSMRPVDERSEDGEPVGGIQSEEDRDDEVPEHETDHYLKIAGRARRLRWLNCLYPTPDA
ncbi:unnamed protein product [Mycena citricolor]|uniref:DDE Tnp4 domain-containing protein n=1 Tax=Mycena citricolor TaxID=2018698 RepID=A0AAD2H0T7_9AGAR|nr:unnamed protein product [Mycena citricolor]